VHGLVDFGRAARLNPYNPDQLRNTGKAYERWAGLGHDPARPNTWDQSLLARAAEAFARAATPAPHHPDPLTSGAQVALWQGRPAQAVALANRALALDSLDGDGYRLRGDAEAALGRRSPAVVDWRRALADPSAGHRGETAAHLAVAEATWAHAKCQAVADARRALDAGDEPYPTTMREIVFVDGPRCPGA
jgi:tetratricopeptide (TPR) repeat protein